MKVRRADESGRDNPDVGKTTLLAALLALVPARERIVIFEDSRELAPNHPHVVRIEGRPVNTELAGAISLTDLVRQV
jgi:pilus assembly protein CpaF